MSDTDTSRARFIARWQPDRPQPVARPFPWPVDLPALYARVQGAGAVLLESLGGPPEITRYSILGVARAELSLPGTAPSQPGDGVASALEAALSRLPGPRALPLEAPYEGWPFVGGWIGYLSYDLGRAFERLPATLPEDGPPPVRLLEVPCALVCDYARGEAALIGCLEPAADAGSTWRATLEALDELEAVLTGRAPLLSRAETDAEVDAADAELHAKIDAEVHVADAEAHAEIDAEVDDAGAEAHAEIDAEVDAPDPEVDAADAADAADAGPRHDATAVRRALPRAEARLEPFRLLEPLASPFSPREYQQAVAQARDYVHAGDLFQVNISQRYSAAVAGDPFALYRRLRTVSPSPFAAYLDLGDMQILSSSPERFLLIEPDRLETRPIKGTYGRGADESEDSRLAEALQADPKERAEHVMIVDLERNDLGRLAAPDSVSVPELLRVERYPQVLHLVSVVEARPARPFTLWEILQATFPGGSISGAPKVRSLEVIEELERSRRGVYTGAVGYISRCGRIDLNLAIRTLVVRKGRLEMQVGGGITAGSQPVREYEETLLKARGMRLALGLE